MAEKACAEAGIPRERIVLLGDETAAGYVHLSEMFEARPRGERERLDCETDLAFLVYSSGTTVS